MPSYESQFETILWIYEIPLNEELNGEQPEEPSFLLCPDVVWQESNVEEILTVVGNGPYFP